jgi:outer membrane lipoprotein carrier protein
MRVRSLRKLAAATLVAFALLPGAASAGGLDQLKAFVDGTRSGKSSFQQVVTGKDRRDRASAGTFSFQRPGRFRWSYDKPIEQLIVGDGTKLWIFDRDLNQVIVRSQAAALGGSPAALLAGDNALERNFTLTDAGSESGLAMVEARPKSADGSLSRVRIGFRDNLPRRMELLDAFGNSTVLTFDHFERNPALDPALFAFTPPAGADVVGE